MAGPLLVDRCAETTTTTGTGTVTLAGAKTGYQSFAAVGNGNTCYYTIAGGSEWEVGIGTYTASGTTLSRDTVLASSNSGSLVSFSAGTKDVFVDAPSSIIPIGRGGLIVPKASSFSSIGTGTTLTDKTDRLQLSCTASATAQLRGGTINSIATPYTIDMAGGFLAQAAASDAAWFGIGVSDGTKYRMWYAGTFPTAANSAVQRAVIDSWTNVTTFSATVATTYPAFDMGDFFIRITDDGTTRSFCLSLNGKDYALLASETSNTFVTPTKFVFASYCKSTVFAPKAYIKHWLVSPSVLGDAS